PAKPTPASPLKPASLSNKKASLDGLVHSALTALVAGIALVGIRYPLHNSDSMKWPLPDNAKIGMKLLFVLIILALAFANRKKETVSSNVWSFIGALTIGNIIIAVAW
ncbi:MAG: hypothetical protein EBU66_18640, partial [Bacteroidetes bacterium]|nr:hypothetical protein [Bacteroidota bacterium]